MSTTLIELSLEKSVKGEEQADPVEDWTSLLGTVKEVGLQETRLDPKFIRRGAHICLNRKR